MASIVLIESNDGVKTVKTKEVSLDNLYKKCGFRVSEDFLCRHTWCVKVANAAGQKEEHVVSLWAKKTGKANSENKYDFPPPVDNELYFGTCAIVRTVSKDDQTFMDLTKETWLKIYEKLFGGFEDIGSEDEYSEDELANVDPALLTKNGYLKDGFVVSDKELTSQSGSPSTESDSEEEFKPLVKKVHKVVKTKAAKTAATPKATTTPTPKAKKVRVVKPKAAANAEAELNPNQTPPPKGTMEEDPTPGDTMSELEEEIYTFSDDD